MAGKQPHLVDRLSERIGQEVERVTDHLADKVNAELLDDNRELPRGEFLTYWRQNWGNPQWRAQQLERMGPNDFVDATNAAFEAPKPEPLGRLAREGMAKQAVAKVQAPTPVEGY